MAFIIPDQGNPHPHMVVFTPRGELLSCNQSQPSEIQIWPEVDSLWFTSNIKGFAVKDINYIEKY